MIDEEIDYTDPKENPDNYGADGLYDEFKDEDRQ